VQRAASTDVPTEMLLLLLTRVPAVMARPSLVHVLPTAARRYSSPLRRNPIYCDFDGT